MTTTENELLCACLIQFFYVPYWNPAQINTEQVENIFNEYKSLTYHPYVRCRIVFFYLRHTSPPITSTNSVSTTTPTNTLAGDCRLLQRSSRDVTALRHGNNAVAGDFFARCHIGVTIRNPIHTSPFWFCTIVLRVYHNWRYYPSRY